MCVSVCIQRETEEVEGGLCVQQCMSSHPTFSNLSASYGVISSRPPLLPPFLRLSIAPSSPVYRGIYSTRCLRLSAFLCVSLSLSLPLSLSPRTILSCSFHTHTHHHLPREGLSWLVEGVVAWVSRPRFNCHHHHPSRRPPSLQTPFFTSASPPLYLGTTDFFFRAVPSPPMFTSTHNFTQRCILLC